MYRSLLALTSLVLCSSQAMSADWFTHRGDFSRNGISQEKGLLKEWPKSGPKLVWEYQGVGTGYASPCVVKGTVYTTGAEGGSKEKLADGYIYSIDNKGKLNWKTKYGIVKKSKWEGTRTTPTYSDGKLYILTTTGDLICFDAKKGKKLWNVNITKKYGAKKVKWNITESPLIDGNNVICTPGGSKALIVALNKKTGKEVWVNNDLGGRKSAYCSASIVKHKGKDIILTNVEKASIGLDPKTGKLLFEQEFIDKNGQNQITPVYNNGHVFITNTRGATPMVFKIADDAKSVEKVWENKILAINFGGVVLHDGYLYGATKKGWVCQDFMSGEQKWKKRGPGEGAMIMADGMLYGYNHKGTLSLAKASPESLQIVSEFKLDKSSQKKQNYAHPAISDGKLYVRHGDKMLAFNIKK